MKFTIKNKPELCVSCRYSAHRRTEYTSVTLCQAEHPAIQVVGVLECSQYKPFTISETPWEYKDAAWSLELDKKGHAVGFSPPKKNKNET